MVSIVLFKVSFMAYKGVLNYIIKLYPKKILRLVFCVQEIYFFVYVTLSIL